MRQQEVNHLTLQDAIDHVTDRAAEDQRESKRKKPLPAMPDQEPQEITGRQDPDSDKKPALPSGGVRQKAERGPRVENQRQIEPVLNHDDPLAWLQRTLDLEFSGLIQNDHEAGQAQPW